MCLVTKQLFPKIAFKDIECYKVLILNSKKEYLTPFRVVHVDISVPLIGKADSFIRKWNLNKRKSIGFIHVFDNRKQANILKGQLIIDINNPVVFKCVIPKGTLYYKGDNHDICATKIKFIEKL